MRRSKSKLDSARSPLVLACALALSLFAVIAPVTPAGAATVTDRPLLFSFDGSDTTAGPLVKPNKIAVDNSSGAVYVAEGEDGPEWSVKNALSKFNADGTAADFSATGTSSLFGTPESSFGTRVGVAVDNSGGPNQGRLYVADRDNSRLIAFTPEGTFLWELELGKQALDVAVDPSGHPWVLVESSVREYASSGAPIPLDSFAVSGSDGLDIDANGDVYVAGSSGVRKYVADVFDSTLDPTSSADVYVDQSSSSGHVFVVPSIANGFSEYDAGGSLIGAFDKGTQGGAITFSGALDRVYLSNRGTEEVNAFGPKLTGTAPDPTIEATVTSGPGTATFHGTINPQGVASAYYFEWSRSSYGEFGQANRSPTQTLPEDSSPHAVQYKATNVMGTYSWRVRLVAVSTATGLRTTSAVDTFKPPKAAANPAVTINNPSAVTSTTAHISGTINPKEDSVNWRVEYSTNPSCAEGWELGKINFLAGGEVNTPQNVETDLKALLPSRHYCVRFRANNSFDLFGTGSVTEIKQFNTPTLLPSEVSTAFAAPRTDTTARINGRVNPRGNADFKYQFEWSEDGSNWTPLPLRESSIDATEPVVVADELTNLKPNTTYHYRLAFAENETGISENEAGPGGGKDEGTFTTRTTAEMVLPQRGDEMVNNPDTGNQNVFMEFGRQIPFMSTDGNRVLWAVSGGAPGSFTGVFAQFLAERTPTGWSSRNLVPPATEQFGEGRMRYSLAGAGPDFTHFLARVKDPSYAVTQETLARLDDDENQDVLGTFNWSEGHEALGGMEMSDDGAHALAIDPETKQLVDVGSGSPEVISLMPDQTPSECGLNTAIHPGFAPATPTGTDSAQWRIGYQMMARTDASIVYFRAKPNGECGARLGLYVRDRETEQTTLIAPGEGGKEVEFIRASPDGRLAFFLTTDPLSAEDQNLDIDLYRWNQDTGESTCMTCVVPDARIIPGAGGSGPGSFLSSPVMISDDLSHAYFQSTKRLVPGEGVSGKKNLYVLSGGTIRFIGVLNTELLEYFSTLSSDGNILLFASGGAPGLTADSVHCNESSCEQLYRYDDRDGSLQCLTCLAVGVTTHGLPISMGGGGFELSADGSTIAFTTFEGLLPADVNHTVDVYEWRGGSLGLLSDGLSEAQSNTFASPGVWGMSADGSDILFAVAQPGLTGFEQNRLRNLYDARIGGGFEPPGPPIHCSGDSCQGPLVPAPEAGKTASSSFSGYGNEKHSPAPRRPCAKKRGKAKQRCVRKHKRHSQKARANDNAGRTK